jgi:hypothetical protein
MLVPWVLFLTYSAGLVLLLGKLWWSGGWRYCCCAWPLPMRALLFLVSRPGKGSRHASTSTVTAVALDPDTGYCWAGTSAGEVVVVRWVVLLLSNLGFAHACLGCYLW